MKCIAIVEDERFMREELSDILRKAGYKTKEITTFKDATDQLLRLSPDLVLLDLNLPGMSGFQICREIKRKSSVPVLVLTSRDQIQDELQALDLGADEYLTKPCRKERLLARVANVMKRFEGRSNLLEGPGFLLDRQTYTLYIHNRSAVLPKNQGKILEVFLSHGDEIVTKKELCILVHREQKRKQAFTSFLHDTEEHREELLKILCPAQRAPVRLLGRTLRDQQNAYDNLKIQINDYLFEPVHILSCIEEVLDDYKPLLEEKQFQIQFSMSDDTVYTDQRGLRFLLRQIISNSIKYCGNKPALNFTSLKEKGRFVCAIKDNGIGVRGCDLPYLFEKGFTGDSGKERKKATGMGLYLAKEMAKELNITLQVKSEWKKGFEIRIYFPLVDSMAEFRQNSHPAPSAPI